MDFSFSDEQILLRDSVERFIAEEYDFETRRSIADSEAGFRRDLWSRFAGLGWLGLPFAEEDGGIGATPVETMVIMEALGRGLVLEPYLACVVLAGGALRLGGSARQRREWLPHIADGTVIAALAHGERNARYNLRHVSTTARADGDGYLLNGHKSVVLWGPAADCFVISARTGGAPGDSEGVSLFWLAGDAGGLSRRSYPAVDGSRASDLILDNVHVPGDALIGAPGQGLKVIEAVYEHAIAAVCAEAVGAMEAATRLTLDYVKTRKQFGTEIGKFQVIQHRMADMHMACEEARSMACLATLKLDEADAVERARAISAAKVKIGQTGRFVGQQAIQLHGGMGMTNELSIATYFKRLTMIDALFGNSAHHLRALGTVR